MLTEVILGANLSKNEYGHRLFADYFYFITGFHGFHVFSGVILLIVILINVIKDTYERRGHYEMVEKVGLYWHCRFSLGICFYIFLSSIILKIQLWKSFRVKLVDMESFLDIINSYW